MAKSALKFKDSVAAYEQLAGQIAARRFVPIYLLMGEESYFKKQKKELNIRIGQRLKTVRENSGYTQETFGISF